MTGRRVPRSGAEGGTVGPGEGQPGPGIAGGVACRWLPRSQLLLREDPAVAGSAPEDLGAGPVALATAGAASTAPVRALVDPAEVPARHVAGRTLAEGVDARRDDVADRNYGNNKNRYHARYSLMTLTRTARSPGTAFHTGQVPRSGEGWPPPQVPGLDLTPSTYSLAQSKPLCPDM